MIPELPISSPTVATVAIVGAGRLGRAVARALATNGIDVVGPIRRGERVNETEVQIALLCVPDAAISGVAAHLRQTGFAGLIGHTSGATPLQGSGADLGLHPLQTFTGTEDAEAFTGIGFAIAGDTPAALAAAEGLATALGGRAFEIRDPQRAAYHAAASLASNYLVTLLHAAEQVASTAGVVPADARALLLPLVASTVQNWASLGPTHALTGPVARGDHATVARQRQAVQDGAPHLIDTFDILSDATRALAERSRGAE